jgi:two-component system, NtrC family, sensor kinase
MATVEDNPSVPIRHPVPQNDLPKSEFGGPAQEALREREAQLQLLLDSTAEAIYGTDLNGDCTFSNRACLKLLGYKHPNDLLGQHMHTLVHHSHADGSSFPEEECRIYKTFRQGGSMHVDSEVMWKADGSSFPCEYWSYPVWREGKLTGCVVTFVDITARKLAEAALRAAHAESELFINSVPSVLIGADAGGHVTRWNLAAADIFGLSASTVRGKLLKDCGIQWATQEVIAEIDSWLEMEETSRRINLPFDKDGERRFLGLTINRVMFADQKNLGFLITGADITERRHLEEQLRQAQKLEAIGQLAAGIAHEINTPTQYVGDNATFLKESWSAFSQIARAAQRLAQESRSGSITAEATAQLDQCLTEADVDYLLEEIPRAIDQSLEGVQRVAQIVRAMKEFSHPGAEEKSALDINRAIETTITVTRGEWKYVSEVDTQLDPHLPLVHCHAGEFGQVILNLLINAAHAIRQVVGDGSNGKGKIVIRTRGDQNWVEISIQDTGCGIPEKIQSRIFEPFFTTKPVGQGTGQGLALAHAVIVRKHGGRIWFETAVGKGTTFFLSLPVLPLMPEL